MEIEQKARYKKITISLDQETYNKLEKERTENKTPVSANLVKAYNEIEREREINKLLKQQINQANMLLLTTAEKIEEAQRKVTETEAKAQEYKEQAERYSQQKNKGYFEKVIRAIFNIND